MHLASFKEKPILGIARGILASQISPLVETVIAAGLETLEITMNTPEAASLIRQAKKTSAGRLTLGAGTVLSMRDLKLALNSGATFIVMPVLIKDVTRYCLRHKIPVFPGALTPGEIFEAWNAGATMVKVFPANSWGPGYLREIKGPFKTIELLACGGVTAENLKDYLNCGASGVTFGASILRMDWLSNRNFNAIGNAVKNFISSWELYKDKKA